MSKGSLSTPFTLTLPQVMQQAGAAYSCGEWTRAGQLARAVLTVQATHFDALKLLGIITAQTQRLGEAASRLGGCGATRTRATAIDSSVGSSAPVSRYSSCSGCGAAEEQPCQ